MTKRYDIIWLDKTDSTNEEAKRHISSLDNLSVLSASEQTSGKGQRGNTWSAAAGENLTFSIVVKYGHDLMPEIRAIDQFAINEITALSVVDLLAAHGIEAKIKWPNDIYVGDSKICGILIEHSVRDGILASSIIGVGLNVNQTEFDHSLSNPTSMILQKIATSHPLLAMTCERIGLHEILQEYMEIFSRYIDRYLNITGGLSRLRKLYLAQMWRKDIPARYIDYTNLPAGHLDTPVPITLDTDSSSGFTGIIRDLSPNGSLLVEDLSVTPSRIREFSFKEIGYIIKF